MARNINIGTKPLLKALIIDDEPFAHDVVLHHLKAHQDITVVNQCYNATQALSWLANNQADLLFLDINMPQLSGIEFLRVLANKPQVIIVSAYQEYAIEGFELDVTDYLLKPICEQRFNQALDRVRQRLSAKQENLKNKAQQQKPVKKQTHIIVKIDREKHKIAIANISLLEAYGNFVKLWQDEQLKLITSTLKQLLEQLPSEQFTQVHKSFAVNNSKVKSINTDSLTLECGKVVKITKSFKKNVQAILD